MKILGIDPGTLKMGWGLIEFTDGVVTSWKSGIIQPRSNAPIKDRLVYLFKEVLKGVERFEPDAVAFEEGFIGQNPKTGMAIGQARAVVILAAGLHDIESFGYTPQRVKLAATGFGNAEKEQVAHMMALALGTDRTLKWDEADALAVAMCHAHHHGESQTLLEAVGR